MNSSAPSICNHLLRIRDDLVGLLLPVVPELCGDGCVRHGDDLGCKDRGVVAPVQADRGHRDPRGHLDHGEQRIHVDGAADGDSDHGFDGEGRHHSRERGGEARDGDENVGIAACHELLDPVGGAVRGCDRYVEGYPELLQNRHGLLGHGHVALASHDDGDLSHRTGDCAHA